MKKAILINDYTREELKLLKEETYFHNCSYDEIIQLLMYHYILSKHMNYPSKK